MHDVLVHASNYSAATNSMRYAAQLSKKLDASLTAMFVAEPVVPIGSIGITPVVPEIYAAAAQVVEQARQAEGAFLRWAREQGVAHPRWQVASAFLPSALASAGNWHDVLVLECGTAWGSLGTLGEALVTCGLPSFVVPEACTKAASLDSIAIASHGSPEAIRATHAALPLLRRSKRIVLLKGQPADTFSTVDFRPPFSVEDHLRQHGLAFETRVLEGEDDDRGAAILEAAAEAGADLLVMGAYGRTRFSEWVFGGVTRHVLAHATLPLFMRH